MIANVNNNNNNNNILGKKNDFQTIVFCQHIFTLDSTENHKYTETVDFFLFLIFFSPILNKKYIINRFYEHYNFPQITFN